MIKPYKVFEIAASPYPKQWCVQLYIKGVCETTLYSFKSENDLIKRANRYIFKAYCKYFFGLFLKISLTNYLLMILILLIIIYGR